MPRPARHAGKDESLGYAGKVLWVDLTRGTLEARPLDMDIARRYLGGHGIAARLLYDLVPPDADPLSPENAIVFGGGALAGTIAPTGTRSSFLAKSPVSGFVAFSNAGYMGDDLKYAGYDFIVVTGRSETPVYLEVTDGTARLRGAGHLWGKDTYETVDRIWEELGPEYQVLCIGPAGENLVRWACVLGHKSHAFGRSGVGAVFGSKRLKAIAVHGTGSVQVADPTRFVGAAKDAIRDAMADKQYIQMWRDGGTWGWQRQSWGKVRVDPEPDLEVLQWPEAFRKRYKKREVTCPACPVGCKMHLTLVDGKYENLDFAVGCTSGTMAGPFGTGLGVKGWDDVGYCAVHAQKYGFDTLTCSGLISWAMELFERGIISGQDTGGLELQRGNVEVIVALMRQIAYREGFGAVLADGPKEAVAKIGRNSGDYIHQWKGMALPATSKGGPIDPRPGMTTQGLALLVNHRGHIDSTRFPWMGGNDEEAKLNCVRRYWKHIGIPEEDLGRLIQGKEVDLALFLKYTRAYCSVLNAFGICELPILPEGWPVHRLADAYSAATGMDTSPEELAQAGERILTLLRAFNIRHGATRADDDAPPRQYRESVTSADGKVHPPLKGGDVQRYVGAYYAAMGWDTETGKPTVATLERLGMAELIPDLWPGSPRPEVQHEA